jgi:hypothetical protein
MSSKNKKETSVSRDKDLVSFKPILGIRPGIYLSIGYAAALLLILFFLLVFPGLKNPHSQVRFTSEPWGTAVRMDDTYIGSTPFNFDVPAGNHQFTFVLPGFEEKNINTEIKGSVFASLFFPKKTKIHETMKTDDPVNAFVLGAQSFAEWSFSGEATSIYQHPMDLSNAAYRIGFVENPEESHSIQEVLKASARFASTKTAARDVIRSKMIIDNAGKALSPFSAITSMKDIAQYVSDNAGSSFWLASILPEEEVSAIVDSAWYAEESENNFAPVFGAYDNNVMMLKNLVFRKIPANNFSMYNETFNSDFWICENPITQTDWNTFVSENPKWAAANIDTLISEKLVTDAYLMEINDSRYPYPVVPGISWFAAQAFCDWLSASLDSSMEHYEIRLPSENEWEYAALYNNEILANYGTSLHMIGSFWEWCEDPFVPLNNFSVTKEAADLVSSPKRSVRGGSSWFDSRVSGGIKTRGSLEPNSSSPFVSFRPIIAIKGNVQ